MSYLTNEHTWLVESASGVQNFDSAYDAGEAFFKIDAAEKPLVIHREPPEGDRTIAFTTGDQSAGETLRKTLDLDLQIEAHDYAFEKGYADALERAVVGQMQSAKWDVQQGAAAAGPMLDEKLTEDLKALQAIDPRRSSRVWMVHAPDHIDAPEFLELPEEQAPSSATTQADAAAPATPPLSKRQASAQQRREYLAEIADSARSIIASPVDEVPRSQWTSVEKSYADLLQVPKNALTAEEGLSEATDDLKSFRNTRDRSRAARSAVAMAWKARNQAAYLAAIEEMSQDIAAMLNEISAAEGTQDVVESNSVEPGPELDKEVRAWVGNKWGAEAARAPALENDDDIFNEDSRSSVADHTTAPDEKRTEYRRVEGDKSKLLAPVPQHVRRRFISGDKDHYYFDARRERLAFVDKGLRLETQDNSPVVAQSFVDIAMARGWETIVAKGGKDFRREVWLAAELAGAKVIGYDPTEADKELLERKLEQRGFTRKEAAQRANVDLNTVEPGFEKELAAGPSAGGEKQSGLSAAVAGKLERTHDGMIVEHGPAPYKFDKENDPSYFVRLEQDGRTRDVWGKGLQGAVKDAGAEVGDVVSLKKVSAEPVTVSEAVRNSDGKVIGERSKESVLNGWLVEKAQDFRTLPPEHSLAKHPDLIDAHATMATTATALANKYPNVASKIKEKIRDELASKIERGEPIKAPRVAAAKAAERTPEPARTTSRQVAEQER